MEENVHLEEENQENIDTNSVSTIYDLWEGIPDTIMSHANEPLTNLFNSEVCSEA